MEIRNTLNIDPKDPLEIFVEGERIILKKYEPSCIFCGDTDNNAIFNGKRVCRKCISKLQEEI
jgi:transcriptional pleiotropic regulator of transition state genes